MKQQKQRTAFIKDFLNRDVTDVSLYDVIFNCATSTSDQIADMICYHVLTAAKK